ncbi:hypothetical protein AKJ16_DCAP10839 [Drosera capensis]
MPRSYKIVPDKVTIGGVPDRPDLIIPVATVSGLHDKIQRKEGSLLITDLGSTNGTFIDEKRLKPGLKPTYNQEALLHLVNCPALVRMFLTLSRDIHLPIFRVSKLQRPTEALQQEPGEPKEIALPEGVSEAAATVS